MSVSINQVIDVPFPLIDGVRVSLPPVSVIIANYNQGCFIKDAILSVAQQSYSNFECVIVDDCSTDDSVEHIRAALDSIHDPRFKLIERDQNGGQMAAMFTGFDASSGPFVAFLDADDIWFPSFLEKHISCHMSPEINAALSSSNLAVIGADGTLVAGASPSLVLCSPGRDWNWVSEIDIPGLKREVTEQRGEKKKTMFVRRFFQEWIWAPTSGLVFRRVVLEALRPQNLHEFRICADLYLARFAHIIGGTIITHEVHGYYRIHGSNMWSKSAVFGDGVELGNVPKSVGTATRKTMVEKLCTDEFLSNLLRDDHRAAVVSRLAKSPEEYRLALNSASIKKHLSAKLKRKMRRRVTRQWLKSLFGLQRPAE